MHYQTLLVFLLTVSGFSYASATSEEVECLVVRGGMVSSEICAITDKSSFNSSYRFTVTGSGWVSETRSGTDFDTKVNLGVPLAELHLIDSTENNAFSAGKESLPSCDTTFSTVYLDPKCHYQDAHKLWLLEYRDITNHYGSSAFQTLVSLVPSTTQYALQIDNRRYQCIGASSLQVSVCTPEVSF